MTPKIQEQIMAVRKTAETNMFDTNAVMVIANREGFYELVCYIDENKQEYARFILTGKMEEGGDGDEP